MRREELTQGLLPSGYRLLYYIESTGTQYIKTPYRNALDYHHEITFDTNTVTWIVGDVQGAGSVNDFGINSNTGRGIIRFSQRYDTNVLSFGIGTGWHTITVDKQGYSVDGVQTNWSSPATSASGR